MHLGARSAPPAELMYYVYGDESIVDDTVVYGVVIAPQSQEEEIETIIRGVKINYGASPTARFHCRQLFHHDSRRKSVWSHLSEIQCHQMAVDLTVALGGKGLMTIIGHLDGREAKKVLPSVGPHQALEIQNIKQLVPFAFLAAIAQLSLDPKFKNQIKLWVDPDSSMVKWWGGNRQAQRLLSVGEMNFELLKRVNEVLPQNLQTKEKPTLLEVADLLSYSSARVLAKRGKPYDHVFEEIVRLIAPVRHPFKWMD